MAEKRIGRPRLPSGELKAKTFTFRVHDRMRERLTAAAAQTGRSVAEEISARLEASLRGDETRTLIREEIRAALAERGDAVLGERQVDAPGQLYRY